jgi:hypothetical protein
MSTGNLVSVLYVSSATKEMTPPELLEMLTDIREKNKRQEITGMLLYRGGNFLQVIEGPETAVDGLLKALEHDPAHYGMIVLCRNHIAAREFGDWRMAFRDISHEDLSEMEGYSRFMEAPFTDAEFQCKPKSVYRLLVNFKTRMR